MSNEVIEALSMPAVLVSAEGGVEGVNGAGVALFGDVLGRHHVMALRQPGVLDAVETAKTEARQVLATYLTTDARRDVTWQVTVTPLPSGKVLLIFEDRTEVEEAGQSRRDFVANVSHELRTPLTALSGFIETLRGAAKDDAVARERFLEIMEREAARMNRLVADLLSLSRVEADERVRPTQHVDLAAITKATLSALAALAEDRGVHMSSGGLDRPAMLAGDADQLSQVVTNLVENALKYTDKGQKVLVEVSGDDPNALLRGPAWVLTVRDTGAGFDPVHIPRLTERFYRVDDHRSREMGGTGLGLAIVKHIVNRHRGRLRIASDIGKGSTFSVVLPALSIDTGDAPDSQRTSH